MGALGSDDLFALSRIALAQDRVDRLLYRATEKLAAEFSPLDDSEEFAFEPGEEGGPDEGVYYAAPAPDGSWLEDLREAELFVMVATDADDEDETAEPLVYVGAWWNAGREGKQRIAKTKWEDRVRDSLTRDAPTEIEWDKNMISVALTRPLRHIADEGNTIAQQANLLAKWAQRSLLAVLKLPAPPNADEETADDAKLTGDA